MNKLKQLAKSLGCAVECDSAGRWTVYQVCAPEGMVFVDNGASHLRLEWIKGTSGVEAILDGIARLRRGLATDPESEESILTESGYRRR